MLNVQQTNQVYRKTYLGLKAGAMNPFNSCGSAKQFCWYVGYVGYSNYLNS